MKKAETIKHGTVNYGVGDFLIKIKNCSMAKNKSLVTRYTKHTMAIAETLKKLGYLDEVKKDGLNLHLSLAFKNKRPVVMDLKLVSKPGLRVYKGVDEIESKKGPSLLLISTPLGVISSKEAVKKRVGGEVIAEIW